MKVCLRVCVRVCVCISLSPHNYGKGINPSTLPKGKL